MSLEGGKRYGKIGAKSELGLQTGSDNGILLTHRVVINRSKFHLEGLHGRSLAAEAEPVEPDVRAIIISGNAEKIGYGTARVCVFHPDVSESSVNKAELIGQRLMFTSR